ncbi:DUF6614 family protein [Ovoidimarina sediminis]|uniref:DUF6614 family protein n=1 Tax=Ovoidimarina sediminis TaxID=3079856 RepID=UPI00291064F5|nr:DUF6614 family protein [Rhodophyticola sp. MJ-SS7]MDU8943644.1 DUF6614 family protein [Rhodophyticola sp. MJ-SS7]
MPQLLNQFDLKPGVTRARFDAAWEAFIAHLLAQDLAVSGGPLMARQPGSGFDTDSAREYSLMGLIAFRDQAQADAAWEAIETRAEPLGQLHRAVFALVHDPVFTFWTER